MAAKKKPQGAKHGLWVQNPLSRESWYLPLGSEFDLSPLGPDEHSEMLARTERWNRARTYLGKPVNVADHAILAACLAEMLQRAQSGPSVFFHVDPRFPAKLPLACLHHDDEEALLGDTLGPLKSFLASPELGALESNLREALKVQTYGIAPGEDLSLHFKDKISQADKLAAYLEALMIYPREDVAGALQVTPEELQALRSFPPFHRGIFLVPLTGYHFLRENPQGETSKELREGVDKAFRAWNRGQLGDDFHPGAPWNSSPAERFMNLHCELFREAFGR